MKWICRRKHMNPAMEGKWSNIAKRGTRNLNGYSHGYWKISSVRHLLLLFLCFCLFLLLFWQEGIKTILVISCILVVTEVLTSRKIMVFFRSVGNLIHCQFLWNITSNILLSNDIIKRSKIRRMHRIYFKSQLSKDIAQIFPVILT